MNHLQNLGTLANIFFGQDAWFYWWQYLLFLLLIGLVVGLVIMRKRGQ